MNHIRRLMASKAHTRLWVESFRKHLDSDKFRGTEVTRIRCENCAEELNRHDRKDWISTGDVLRWLERLDDLRSEADSL